MSEDFKFLGNNNGSSNFPDLNNLNVQKTVTNFNYTVWGENTKIYLKHVPASWTDDYKNVVKFENKEVRDRYFKENNPIVLTTEFRIKHDGKVRLPIPFDNLINFNYLIAEYPNAPIPDYENNKARKEYYYFIKDCEYISPNTTEVTIELDVWTSYIDDIEISNMQLERGHYAMTLTTLDEYLHNPLVNNDGLLTPDIVYDKAGNIKKLTKVLYDGYAPDKLINFMAIVTTAALYDNNWNDNVPTANNNSAYHPVNNNCNNLNILYINSLDWPNFCNEIQEKLPQFFQTVVTTFKVNQQFFLETYKINSVDEIKSDYKLTMANIDVKMYYKFTPVANYRKYLDLSKEAFNYPKEYADLVKLYTSPYAIVEVSQSSTGITKEILIQAISADYFHKNTRLSLLTMANLDYPFLGVFACIENVNTFDDGSSVIINDNGDWTNYMFKDEFPRYAMIQNGHKKYMFETKYPRIQQQNDINTSYNNDVRSANTAKAIADASALTSKTNADASAATGKTNADASAAASKANADGSAATSNTNTLGSIITGYNINKRTLDETKKIVDNNYSIGGFADRNDSRDIKYASEQKSLQNGILSNDNLRVNIMNSAALSLKMDQAALSFISSGVSGVISNGLSGAATGAMMGGTMGAAVGPTGIGLGATIGAGLGIASSNINSLIQGANLVISMNKDESYQSFINQNNSEMVTNKIAQNNKFHNLFMEYRGDKFALKVEQINSEKNITYDMNLNNATDSRDQNTANQSRTYNQSLANNARSYNTAVANNARSYNTSITNNSRSYNQSIANNKSSYDTTIANLNASKANSEEAIRNAVNQSYMNNNVICGDFNDDFVDNTHVRGIYMKLKTQPKDSIRKTGDYFLRYGYSFDGNCEFESFNLMTYYTYWKCNEVWLNSDKCNNKVIDIINSILTEGVTVWKDPNTMGNVSIYDNKVL